MLTRLKPKNCGVALLGGAILAFGLYNVHSLSGVTEGGVLGLTLLLEYWFGLSPAISGLAFNLLCYLLGWRLLGRRFILCSAAAGGGFSAFYWLCERCGPLWPQLAQKPLLAAVAGAVFVGLGVGLAVRAGGAPSGDDALALVVARLTGVQLQWVYLFFDLVVLGLSLSYIPAQRIGYSLLTVFLSGQLIGFVQRVRLPRRALQERGGRIPPHKEEEKGGSFP